VKIYVNGIETLIENNDLNSVLVQLGYQNVTIATAINGDFVPLSLRTKSTMQDGDKLEILAPMQGG